MKIVYILYHCSNSHTSISRCDYLTTQDSVANVSNDIDAFIVAIRLVIVKRIIRCRYIWRDGVKLMCVWCCENLIELCACQSINSNELSHFTVHVSLLWTYLELCSLYSWNLFSIKDDIWKSFVHKFNVILFRFDFKRSSKRTLVLTNFAFSYIFSCYVFHSVKVRPKFLQNNKSQFYYKYQLPIHHSSGKNLVARLSKIETPYQIYY